MSNTKCCVPGCENNAGSYTLHKFPNPEKNNVLFNSWVRSVGGDILGRKNDYIFKYRRVCHTHFEGKYLCRYNRLSNIAVPTLNMPDSTATDNKEPNPRQKHMHIKTHTETLVQQVLHPESSQKLAVEKEELLEDKDYCNRRSFDAGMSSDAEDSDDISESLSMYCDDGTAPSASNSGEKRNELLHESFKCNICSGEIVGYRYTCVQCTDYDLCSACEASGVHPHHYVLRVPGPRPQKEIEAMLERIRSELNKFKLSFAAPTCSDNEIRVKTETKDDIEESENYVINDMITNTEPVEVALQEDKDPLSIHLTQIDNSNVDKPLLSPKEEPCTTDKITSDEEVVENVDVTQRLATTPKENTMPEEGNLTNIKLETSMLPQNIRLLKIAPQKVSTSERCYMEREKSVQNESGFPPRIIIRRQYLKQAAKTHANIKPGKSKTGETSVSESKLQFIPLEAQSTSGVSESILHGESSPCFVPLKKIRLDPIVNTHQDTEEPDF